MERKTVYAQAGAIMLGKQEENDVTEILFACPENLIGENWVLSHRRATDSTAYPVALEKRENGLVWVVTSADTAIPGRGYAELTCYGKGGEVLKSQIYATNVTRSLGTGESIPDPVKPWYEALMAEIEGIASGGGTGSSLTDTEALELMMDTDTLNAVYNVDGAILTDTSGNIILRA